MNDIEICKRIAEIEGIAITVAHKRTSYAYLYVSNDLGLRLKYNPLTDDALNHRLMIKYKLSLIAPEGDQKDWDCVISHVLTTNTNPNKAICLAIIEANK